MKRLGPLFFGLMILVSGCSTLSHRSFREAREMVASGQAECILLNNKNFSAIERGRGVSPLLVIYDRQPHEIVGGIIVDKVIGRAAAAIAICGKVSHVHGEIMSEDAVEFLTAHGITSSYKQLVPRILNQNRDGLCPLEQSVEGIDDPVAAVAALRKKIESFKQKAP